jgi:two-component system sensor histidine kinase KdpD
LNQKEYAKPVSELERPSPDALLAAIQANATRAQSGRLKVFLGMSPGVGKTYAMLEAAQRELKAGRDVAIGYVETHGRAETDALTLNLPLIPRRSVEYRGVALTEMDLDAVLARRPQLTLVDELAHTNAPGSRHPKRWQDVRELLDAGLDVFTTLNVQHIESRAELVRQITGATIQETVPDSILDTAEFELVDLPPGDLLRRLAEGKVYVTDRAAAAVTSFFREGNLMALREIALRLAAEHAGQEVREFLAARQNPDAWKTGQRLLTAIGPSPMSEPLARWTRKLADSLGAPWLAVHVDTGLPLQPADQARLEKNLALARELGAEVIATTDRDIVAAVLRVARQHNVTQIVVGKPTGWRVVDLFRGGSMLSRLIRESGNIDVLCVRAEHEGETVAPSPFRLNWHWATRSTPAQYTSAVIAVALTTALNLIFREKTGPYAASLVYLLVVVGLGLFVGRGPALLAATGSALLWNLLFLPPLYKLTIGSPEDALVFMLFFAVALVTGQLTSRIRAQGVAEREREERATALYLLTRSLAEAKDPAELLAVAVRLLGETFRADVAVLLPEGNGKKDLVPYPFGTLAISEKDEGVAAWAFNNAKPAGRGTDTLTSAAALFLPLSTPAGRLGVAGLKFRDGRVLSPAEQNLLDSFIRQIALVLDRARLRDAEASAALLAESERLGRTLLNSVSHELRTPLAAITSAASGLRDAGPLNSAQHALVAELDEAAARLNRLVRNLLDLSRLEAGLVRPKPDWHDLRDVVQLALQSLGKALEQHPLTLDLPPDLPPVKLDMALTGQILVNLLNNAAVHTPAGTAIELQARLEPGCLVLEVADHGPGLPAGDLSRLFDRFQRGPDAAPGGTGLGLSLVKGFAEAQGGAVAAANRPGGGALFAVRLPLAKLPPVPEEKA